MMQLLKRSKREVTIAGAIVLTLLALVVVSAPGFKPSSPTASIGEIFGLGNRTAPGANPAATSSLTDSQIAVYQEKLRKTENTSNYANLGLVYLQKAREVGDPTFYTKAEQVLKKSLELDSQNAEAMGGMGSLALSRHQFAQALDWGQKAKNLRSQTAYNYGVIVDAQVELGRYDDAVQSAQQMVNLRPDISSYSRVSYLRELHGEYAPAVEAMKQAIVASGATPENKAWVTYQLGNLYFSHNELDKAEATYQEALTVLPNYVYAQAGMGQIRAAKNDYNSAIALYTNVTQRFPLPQFIIEFGDLYAANGQTAEANKQYDLVRAIQRIYSENGVNTDLEMALFDADHEINLPSALTRARQEYQQRPSVTAADVLSWILYKTGNYDEAATYSTKAMQLGTQNALFYYHAGMIAAKRSQKAEAAQYLEKALSLNPNFSQLHKKTASETLQSLK